DDTSCHVREHETAANVHEHLADEHGAVVLHAKNREDECEKCGIPRKTDVGGRDLLSPTQTVNAVLQPVFSDVAVDERIRGDAGKVKNKKEPQRERAKRRAEEVTKILGQELAHAANIARFCRCPAMLNNWKSIASN